MALPIIHLIYSSIATYDFSEQELADLLTVARTNNEKLDVSGMLLYTERSFFQILEGDPDIVNQLYDKIAQDKRHYQVVKIIKEPIAKRAFGKWTMGYLNISPQEMGKMVGLNDFFLEASCFSKLDPGRAKKLLTAFKEGRWRAKIRNSNAPVNLEKDTKPPMRMATMLKNEFTFAYQPIIDINTMSVVSFEARVRGRNNEEANDILKNIDENSLSHFDTLCRTAAIEMASKLGLQCNLNLNFLAQDVFNARDEIKTTIETAKRHGIDPSRLVLEIDQDKLIGDSARLAEVIEEIRGVGVKISIAHFGAGRASLSLLEPYRPDTICLSQDLVKEIETSGPRQAIIRGLAQTCADLGIDIVVKYIDTLDGYLWFRDEGFNLFQGNLFAKPDFESLPEAVFPKE